jgi:hypothetical protein
MSASKRITTYEETLSTFAARSPNAKTLLDAWLADPYHGPVTLFVKGHVTREVYRLSVEEVRTVCVETEHALGDVSRTRAESVTFIRDWHPAFAFVHCFHYAIERDGGIPTYQRFRAMCQEDHFLRSALFDPALEAIAEAIAQGARPDDARAALRWRVGNAYYGTLRELYSVVALRERGIDLSYHILADALFATDAWIEDLVLSVYVGNPNFKRLATGRKRHPTTIFADASPPLDHLEICLPAASVFGRVHLPTEDDLDLAAATISRRLKR